MGDTMQRYRFPAVLLLAAVLACQSQDRMRNDGHVADARLFTDHCERSRLAKWNVRATAAGRDCGILYVRTSIILEDSMIEALHYGAGAYAVVRGGVQQFSHDRAFRGVAYQDSSGRIWTFGNVTDDEAHSLQPCH